MADITLDYSAAFTWTEKGEASLRSFTCRCGNDVVDEVNDVKRVTEDFDITCEDCGRTYYAEFLLKLVPYEDDKDTSSPGEGEHHDTPQDLAYSEAEGEQVALRYESSVSKNTKEVRGELTETDGGRSATVKTDEDESHGQPGDEFTVFTENSANRDGGVVTKNSRKVGEFEEAEEL